MTAAVALVLAAVAGWLLLHQMPQLRQELARERQRREHIEREIQQTLNQTVEQLRREREARAKLENQLALATGPEVNVPLVILEATREAEGAGNQLTVPAGAKHLVLWLEVEPGTRFGSFRLQVYTMENRLVQTVEGLKKNAYGALAVSLPAEAFQAGGYQVKLYGVGRQQAALVGEYRLHIRRQ